MTHPKKHHIFVGLLAVLISLCMVCTCLGALGETISAESSAPQAPGHSPAPAEPSAAPANQPQPDSAAGPASEAPAPTPQEVVPQADAPMPVASTAPDTPKKEGSAPAGARSYTVVFIDWQGVVFDTLTLKEGESVSAPSSHPERGGYRFLGWYLHTEEGKEPFSFGAAIGGDALEVKLSAEYKANAPAGDNPAAPAENDELIGDPGADVTSVALEPLEADAVAQVAEEDVPPSPVRGVHLVSNLSGQAEVPDGTRMVLTAALTGYNDVPVRFRWECSVNGTAWEKVSGATGSQLTVELNGTNDYYLWRVIVMPAE